MTGYLLDTCTIRLWYAKNAKIEARVDGLNEQDHLFVSVVTIGEIEFGHLNNRSSDPSKSTAFRRWILETFEVPQIGISASTAWEYARYRRKLFDKFTRVGKYSEEREDLLGKKVGIDENDLWMVSQAYERNLTFVTSDKMSRIRDVADDIDIEYWAQS